MIRYSEIDRNRAACLPWWMRFYGLAWRSSLSRTQVLLPIPLNLIARWSRDAYWLLRALPDTREETAYAQGYSAGWETNYGYWYALGIEEGKRQVNEALKRAGEEWEAAYAARRTEWEMGGSNFAAGEGEGSQDDQR